MAATRCATAWTHQVIQQISADYAQSTNWLHQAASPATVKLAHRLLDGHPDAERRVREQHGYEISGTHVAVTLRCTGENAELALRKQISAVRRDAPGPALVVVALPGTRRSTSRRCAS